MTIAGLAWATTLARVRKGDTGAFWFGFALAGWSSFLLVLDTLGSNASDTLAGWIPEHLLVVAYGRPKIALTTSQRELLVQQWRILH